jgi:hypothetical protein
LIVWQHHPDAIWEMTPRQVFAWLTLGLDRERIERAFALVDSATASHGDSGAIERAVKDLTGG